MINAFFQTTHYFRLTTTPFWENNQNIALI
ncbi:Uncharacterised protein [Vibrio cholerae]|nr:Uncharacterised protein [Vibrio cholerae]